MKFHSFLFCVLCSFTLPGCLKKDYDQPPDTRSYDPGIPVNYAISDLSLLPQGIAIREDIVIAGIVIMDDKEGNYYKKIVVQDSSGGIEVLLDQNNLYNDFPVGRKVYIKCKGLYVGAYGQNPQLGYAPDATGNLSDIPFTLINDYVVKANYPNQLIPDTLSIDQLANPGAAKLHLNTLVTIRDVEFSATGISFAEPASIQSATNRMLQDCNSNKITLRTSGYSKFQSFEVPAGKGTITAIYTRYNNTPQLYIRSPEDALLNGERCDGAVVVAEPLPVAVIRALVESPADSVASLPNYKITGVVISDKGSGNIVTSNIVLQDASGGIVVRFSGTPSFVLGDSLVIDITGGKLSWYNNLLQVSGIATAKVSKLAAGKSISPRIATIEQVIANYSIWESTLVKIANATVAGGGTYSGNKTISDATGSMVMYTRSAALFAGEDVPAGAAGFTGILGIYGTTKQLLLRSLADVE